MVQVIRIKDALSADLALRSRADDLFDRLEKLDATDLIIDFSEVKSISRSFAHQYQARKKQSRKSIKESHTPIHVEKMFDILHRASKKKHVVDSDSMPVMTI